MLSLAEELLLLALDNEKGTIPWSKQDRLKYGLAAAALAELMIDGHLQMVDKKRLMVADLTPTGDDILDEVLEKIGQARKTKDAKGWVTSLVGRGGIKKLQQRIEERLVDRGILRREEASFLRIFTTEHYPTVSGQAEEEEKERIRSSILGNAEPDGRTAAMVSLMDACELTDRVFSKDERKLVKKRIEELSKGEFAGKAVSEVVAEVTATMVAINTAIIAASVASSSGSSSS